MSKATAGCSEAGGCNRRDRLSLRLLTERTALGDSIEIQCRGQCVRTDRQDDRPLGSAR